MKEKYIYKITNLKNNKVYIGQTNNLKRRFQEHKSLGYGEENNKLLYLAFIKYGIDNFSFKEIEKTTNYNEREKYWISYYNTNAAKGGWGYNMTEGGEEPPILTGYNNPLTQHEIKDVLLAIKLLKETTLSFKEIGEKCNYSASGIQRINLGQIWNFDNEIYPIRIEDTKLFKEQRAELIINDLINTRLTQKEIADKYNVKRTTITAINRGQNFRKNNIDYPIRKQNCQWKPVLMISVETNEILKEYPSVNAAARDLQVDATALGACARGETKISFGYKWKYK